MADVGTVGLEHVRPAEVEDVEEHFLKGMVVAFFYLAIFSVIFVPVVWYVSAFVVGPWVAGYRGGRYTNHGLKLGIFAGAIWASLEVILIIYIFSAVAAVIGELKIQKLEIFFLFLIYFFNIAFCGLGGRTSRIT